MLILQGFPPLGVVKQRRCGGENKTSYSGAKFVSVSKTVGDRSKVTIND